MIYLVLGGFGKACFKLRKRLISTITIILFFSNALYSQEGKLKIVTEDPRYTWRTHSKSDLDSFYFELPKVNKSHFSTHFRISFTGQIIDLYSNNNSEFKGSLTNIAITNKKLNSSEGQEQKGKTQFIFQVKPIDKQILSQVANHILKSGQDSIPTDTLIKSWNKYFLHCNSIRFEFKINGEYSEQNFHCPWGQNDSLIYKKTIVSNYKYLLKELNLELLYRQFIDELPKGRSYSKDGYMWMYLMTERQLAYYQKIKPHRDYMVSVKDTLNKYLSDTLTKIFSKKGILNCYYQFFLNFSKNGELKKIRTNTTFADLEDRLDYYKCKRKIRKAFKKIRIDFIKPRSSFGKELNFIDNEVIILQ